MSRQTLCVSDYDSDSDSDPEDLVSMLGHEVPCDEPQPVACVGRAQPVGRAHATMRKMAWYEVLLDNQADISVVHPRLLTNLRERTSYVSGLSGTATLPYVGNLRGFFQCKGSADVIASVLCMADVEELYDISYEQGVSYTVHMDDRDLVFYKRDKLYVADMSDWDNPTITHVSVQSDVDSDDDYGDPTALVTTVADNVKSRGSPRRRSSASGRRASCLVANAGFSSEREALGLVHDGNLTGVPVTAPDVKRSFEIYGKSVGGVRGRRTAHKASARPIDQDLKSAYGEMQVMTGDVVYFNHKPYVMCLSKPLGLLTATPVANTKTKTLGAAVHTHISTVQSRGFLPTIIHLDPQKGFAALDPHIPGVEVDIGGAGDHLNVLDVEIRHVKEIFRSVLDSLPWKQPAWLDKDLVAYCVSRKNLRSTSNSVASARVKFTGRKPEYKKELGIAYGDYCECYVPNVVSNDATAARTEPCIALYPTGNANGSWHFLNIRTKRRVRRSNWDKMVTSELVVNTMSEFSRSEEDAEVAEEAEDEPRARDQHQQGDDLEHVAEIPAQLEGADDQRHLPADEDVEQELGHQQHDDPDDEPELGGDGSEDEAEEPRTRRSARLVAGTRKPMRYRSFHTSVKQGLQEHGADAYKAIVAELRQLLSEKKALQPVHRGDLSARQLKRTIRSLMFLKTKFDGLGRFEKIKARLVANGKQQDRKLYPDTFSPTVALQSVLMCLTVAAAECYATVISVNR